MYSFSEPTIFFSFLLSAKRNRWLLFSLFYFSRFFLWLCMTCLNSRSNLYFFSSTIFISIYMVNDRSLTHYWFSVVHQALCSILRIYHVLCENKTYRNRKFVLFLFVSSSSVCVHVCMRERHASVFNTQLQYNIT